jgi:hypothetical protein
MEGDSSNLHILLLKVEVHSARIYYQFFGRQMFKNETYVRDILLCHTSFIYVQRFMSCLHKIK